MSDSPRRQLDWRGQYNALRHGAGLIELERTQIELGGADRASFLHNLSTNEIKKLPVGAGCEAFLTSVQGRTLAHAFVFAGPESLLIDTVGGQSEKLLAHLDHYLVCEQVTLTDRSGQWTELLLAGPQAESLVEQLWKTRLPATRLANEVVDAGGTPIWLRRVDITGPGGCLISLPREAAPSVAAALGEHGAVPCGGEAFEAARIEAGFPLFDRDITEKNLPQEVARDALAISFVKGCYLGQETVARIDALGHVNKMLVGLELSSADVPEAGTEIFAAGQAVGHVTSAAYSPRLERRWRWATCGRAAMRPAPNYSAPGPAPG